MDVYADCLKLFLKEPADKKALFKSNKSLVGGWEFDILIEEIVQTGECLRFEYPFHENITYLVSFISKSRENI